MINERIVMSSCFKIRFLQCLKIKLLIRLREIDSKRSFTELVLVKKQNKMAVLQRLKNFVRFPRILRNVTNSTKNASTEAAPGAKPRTQEELSKMVGETMTKVNSIYLLSKRFWSIMILNTMLLLFSNGSLMVFINTIKNWTTSNTIFQCICAVRHCLVSLDWRTPKWFLSFFFF